MNTYSRRDLAALVVAVSVLGSVVLGITACGDDDLFFPGELPPTPTEQPTATPDAEDEDGDL